MHMCAFLNIYILISMLEMLKFWRLNLICKGSKNYKNMTSNDILAQKVIVVPGLMSSHRYALFDVVIDILKELTYIPHRRFMFWLWSFFDLFMRKGEETGKKLSLHCWKFKYFNVSVDDVSIICGCLEKGRSKA